MMYGVDTPVLAGRLQPALAAPSINLVDATVSDRSGPRGPQRDGDLLAALGRRDYAAVLDGLMQRYRQKVVNLAFSFVHEPALAQDLAQIAFLKLWQALPQYDGRAALSTWLYAIARNTCLSALRKPTRGALAHAVGIDDLCSDPVGPGTIEWTEAVHDVVRLLDELPEPYRRVVVLFYLEERSCESVADLLGLPQGTVKSLLFRARARLAASALSRDEHSSKQTGVANGK